MDYAPPLQGIYTVITALKCSAINVRSPIEGVLDRMFVETNQFIATTGTELELVTQLPVEKDAGRIRLLLPAQPRGQRLCVVIAVEADPKDRLDQLSKDIILRPLE